MSTYLQKTLKSPIQFEGVGLHTGSKVNLCIKPAEVNSGITFRRTDVDKPQNIIEANYKNVSSTILCTKITNSYGVKNQIGLPFMEEISTSINCSYY